MDAFHFSATSSVSTAAQSVNVHQGYFKNADDAGTVDATGYTGGTTYLVSKVEILSQ